MNNKLTFDSPQETLARLLESENVGIKTNPPYRVVLLSLQC